MVKLAYVKLKTYPRNVNIALTFKRCGKQDQNRVKIALKEKDPFMGRRFTLNCQLGRSEKEVAQKLRTLADQIESEMGGV